MHAKDACKSQSKMGFLMQLFRSTTPEQRYKIAVAFGFHNAYSQKPTPRMFSLLCRAFMAGMHDSEFGAKDFMSIVDMSRDFPLSAIKMFNALLLEHNIRVNVVNEKNIEIVITDQAHGGVGTDRVEIYGKVEGDVVIFVSEYPDVETGYSTVRYKTADDVVCDAIKLAAETKKAEMILVKGELDKLRDIHVQLGKEVVEKKHESKKLEKMVKDNTDCLDKQHVGLKKVAAKKARLYNECIEVQRLIDDLEADLTASRSVVDKLRAECAAFQAENGALKGRRSTLQEENAKFVRQNSKLLEDNAALLRQNSKLADDNASLTSDNAALNTDLARTVIMNSAHKEDAARATMETHALKEDVAALEDELTLLIADRNEVRNALNDAERDLDEERGAVLELYASLNRLRMEIYALGNLIQELEAIASTRRLEACKRINTATKKHDTANELMDTMKLLQLVREIALANEENTDFLD